MAALTADIERDRRVRIERRLRHVVGGLAALVGSVATGNPEHLVPALEFGAKDCAFCHLTPQGGQGHNERGAWLVAERERLGVEAIDVGWLARREARVAAPRAEPSAPVSEAAPERESLAALEPSAEEEARPFDYSTAHGDWPAYGGDPGAAKYSPVDEISAENVDSLRVAWVWEAFDNDRYVGSAGASGECRTASR